MKVGGVEGVGLEIANSLWSFIFSAVDGCMVCDDFVVTCACIILLDNYCLLADSGCVEYELINY